jgi:iron(III) transport system substrate-binding protein
MKKLSLVFLIAAWSWAGLLLLPLSVLGQGQKTGAQAEWEKVLGTARKEGKVVVSVPASAELRKRTEEIFEKRFSGIDVELLAARGASNINRILEEKKAGVNYFDLHVGGTNSIITGLLAEGVLEPIPPLMILPEVKDPKNWWGGHIWADKARQYIYMFQAYITETVWQNTDLVKPGEIASYDDLLSPKWKGKIAILDPRTPGSGDSTWGFLWAVKGEEYLKKLVAQDLIIGRNQRQLAESVAKGKAALSIGLSFYVYQPFIKAGLPLRPVPPPREGFYASSGSGNLAVIKNMPHPNAAKLFINWLLSQEGQETFSRAMGQSSRRLDVDTTWTKEYGHTSAKEALTPERFFELENQSEEKIEKVRKPAAAIARKLLD